MLSEGLADVTPEFDYVDYDYQDFWEPDDYFFSGSPGLSRYDEWLEDDLDDFDDIDFEIGRFGSTRFQEEDYLAPSR